MELNCDVQRKRKISDLRPIASIDTHLESIMNHAEIGTDEVRMLFGAEHFKQHGIQAEKACQG